MRGSGQEMLRGCEVFQESDRRMSEGYDMQIRYGHHAARRSVQESAARFFWRRRTRSLAVQITVFFWLLAHFTCIPAIGAENDPADFIRETIAQIQAEQYNAVLFEQRRWEFVERFHNNAFVDDKAPLVHLAEELHTAVEGIPNVQLKAIGYHFVAGMYNYLRLRYDNNIVYGPLAFASMKNAFDTNNRDAEIVLSYAEMIDDFASRNFLQRALIALKLGINLKQEAERAYEAMEYIATRYPRQEINTSMKTVERGDRFMAMYKKMGS